MHTYTNNIESDDNEWEIEVEFDYTESQPASSPDGRYGPPLDPPVSAEAVATEVISNDDNCPWTDDEILSYFNEFYGCEMVESAKGGW